MRDTRPGPERGWEVFTYTLHWSVEHTYEALPGTRTVHFLGMGHQPAKEGSQISMSLILGPRDLTLKKSIAAPVAQVHSAGKETEK